MPNPELSVVIPAYNEAAVISPTIEAIAAYLTRAQLTHEIIVVDDGSLDETAAVVRALAAARPALRVLGGPHQGKGAAIKQGALAATGRYLLFLDADHSTRIEEIQKCLPWLRQGCEMVIGSRKMPGAVIRVHQPPLREFMGKGFTWVANILLGVRVTDFTCGFKCFQTGVAQRLFRLQRIGGWGFDAELMFLAVRQGYRIKEVPVEWANAAGTKVRLMRDTIRSFTEVVQIRLGARRGWYEDRGDVIVPLRPPFVDERGEIHNLLDTALGSVAVIRSVKGAVRGNHYHKTDYHYCWLQSGKMVYAHRLVGDAAPPRQWVIAPGQMFYTPPMHEHVMRFTEDSVLFVFARNNRQMERYEADTVRITPLPAQGTGA